MKTREEVQKEIEALKAIRPKVRPHSMFGDDNLVALDAQVVVLEDDLDNDDIYKEFSQIEHTLSSALDARTWLDSESDVDSLAEDYPTI